MSEVVDTDLLELRGQSPLVLVPIAGGSDPGVLALLGACMSPARVGRVLLLNVVAPPQPRAPEEFEERLVYSADLLRGSLAAAVRAGARTESLATIALDPWTEIERVARVHRCATLLLGMSEVSDAALRGRLERLASGLRSNLVIARLPRGWRLEGLRRVLVPVRGGRHGALRARLLISLSHRVAPELEVVYLLVLPTKTTPAQRRRRERSYLDLMRTESSTPAVVQSVLSDDAGAAIIDQASSCDLLLLGLSRVNTTERVFGEMIRRIVAATTCAVLVVNERG